MRLKWCLFLAAAAGLCWAAMRPAQAWGSDLEVALANSTPTVVLVALPDRPWSAPTRSAIDAAWNELRPRAQRVLLERPTSRLNATSGLCLCVLSPAGELVARRDGALETDEAVEWLQLGLEAASDSGDVAHDPGLIFERAQRDWRLGAIDAAQERFTRLAANPDSAWQSAAHERLARIALDRGDVVRARLELALAGKDVASTTTSARFRFTRGSIELAERKDRAAFATLTEVVREPLELTIDETEHARLELARAASACGEDSRALALLDELARNTDSLSLRRDAQEFAARIRSGPPAETVP